MFGLLLCQAELSHLDQVLRDFCDSLFALVCDEVWPVYKLFVNLCRKIITVSCAATNTSVGVTTNLLERRRIVIR
jgi:hypothetical protein